MSPLYDFTVEFQDAEGLSCQQALSINVNPTCGAVSPSINGIVWTENHTFNPGCTDVFGTILNGVCGAWRMLINTTTCAGSCSLEWNGFICNLGTPYMITVSIPMDSFGTVGPVPPANSSFDLDIDSVNVFTTNVLWTAMPTTVNMTGMIPTGSNIPIRIYFASIANPAPSGYVEQTANMTITPLFHP